MNANQFGLKKPILKKKVPPYRTLRCPMVGHQASWCRMLCRPIEGYGMCGRHAPHGLVGRTQRAIKNHNKNSTH